MSDPIPATPDVARFRLEQQRKSGASWFYWIAGLSLITSISQIAGGGFRFIAGLGITQIVDAALANAGEGASSLGFLIDVVIAAGFIAIGYLAKRHRGAFITGMIVYAIDGAVLLIASDWLGFAFHLFVLFSISRGYAAARRLDELSHGEVPPMPEHSSTGIGPR